MLLFTQTNRNNNPVYVLRVFKEFRGSRSTRPTVIRIDSLLLILVRGLFMAKILRG